MRVLTISERIREIIECKSVFLFLAPYYNAMDRLGRKPHSLHNQGMRPALNQMGESVRTASKVGLLIGVGHLLYRFSSGQMKKLHNQPYIDVTNTL